MLNPVESVIHKGIMIKGKPLGQLHNIKSMFNKIMEDTVGDQEMIGIV